MNNTYCPRYFNHIFSDSGGRYRLCCHTYVHDNPLEKYNSNINTPFEVYLSEEMEDIRQMSLENKKIPSCQGCYELEEAGAISPRKRLISNQQCDTVVNNVEVKLRIWGNHCNLSCVMCTPYNSSMRSKEFKDLGIEPGHYGGFWDLDLKAKPNINHYNNIKKDILDNINLVGSIYITGGEPFLLPKHYEFLESIPEKYKKNISVNYDTNLSVLKYKNKSIFPTLEKFKSFTFNVSADHYGDKLAYIRWPIDVDQFEKNIEYVQNTFGYHVITQISPTISTLNVEDVPLILDYYENNFKIKSKGYKGIVSRPNILNIRHHRDREKLLARYKNEQWDKKYDMSNLIFQKLNMHSDLNMWNLGIEYLERLDNHRGTNFKTLWPHYDYIDMIKVKNIDV
jgi:organic radical activating enzyme